MSCYFDPEKNQLNIRICNKMNSLHNKKYLLPEFSPFEVEGGWVQRWSASNKSNREFYQDLKLISVADTLSYKAICS